MKKIIASGPITNNMNSLWNKIKLSSKGNNILGDKKYKKKFKKIF